MCMGEIAFMSLERWWCFSRIYFSAVRDDSFKKGKECKSSLKIYIDHGLDMQGYHIFLVTSEWFPSNLVQCAIMYVRI